MMLTQELLELLLHLGPCCWPANAAWQHLQQQHNGQMTFPEIRSGKCSASCMLVFRFSAFAKVTHTHTSTRFAFRSHSGSAAALFITQTQTRTQTQKKQTRSVFPSTWSWSTCIAVFSTIAPSCPLYAIESSITSLILAALDCMPSKDPESRRIFGSIRLVELSCARAFNAYRTAANPRRTLISLRSAKNCHHSRTYLPASQSSLPLLTPLSCWHCFLSHSASTILLLTLGSV